MANLGHCERVREIGAGRMSTTYEAVDTRIGRQVVLTGGASELKGLADYAQGVLGRAVRIGRPRGLTAMQALRWGQLRGFDIPEELCREVARFFKTGTAPVRAEETLEIFAFMEAADESKRQGGAPVSLVSVMMKAKTEAAVKSAR